VRPENRLNLKGGLEKQCSNETKLRFCWLDSSLLLSLEFELATDVIRTAISPARQQIGQLAGIARIRTFLNYFLEKDIEKYAQAERP
jgi:uncharacterized membrane protein